jgi:hypothetical protein
MAQPNAQVLPNGMAVDTPVGAASMVDARFRDAWRHGDTQEFGAVAGDLDGRAGVIVGDGPGAFDMGQERCFDVSCEVVDVDARDVVFA